MKLIAKAMSVLIFSIFCHSASAGVAQVYTENNGGMDIITISVPVGLQITIYMEVNVYDPSGNCPAFAQTFFYTGTEGDEYEDLTAYTESDNRRKGYLITSTGYLTIEATVDEDPNCQSKAYASVRATW